MEEGQHHEHAVRGGEPEEALGVEAVVEGLAVREEGALGDPGRARRVHQDHRVLGRDRLDRRARGGPRQGGLVGVRRAAAADAHGRRLRGALAGAQRHVGVLRVVDQYPRRAVLEHAADLPGREAGVDGDGDGAQLRRGEDHLEVGRAVPEDQGDPVAPGDAFRFQHRRAARDPLAARGTSACGRDRRWRAARRSWLRARRSSWRRWRSWHSRGLGYPRGRPSASAAAANVVHAVSGQLRRRTP